MDYKPPCGIPESEAIIASIVDGDDTMKAALLTALLAILPWARGYDYFYNDDPDLADAEKKVMDALDPMFCNPFLPL